MAGFGYSLKEGSLGSSHTKNLYLQTVGATLEGGSLDVVTGRTEEHSIHYGTRRGPLPYPET